MKHHFRQGAASKAYRGDAHCHRLNHAAWKTFMKPAGRAALHIQVRRTEQIQNVFSISPKPHTMNKPCRSDLLVQFATKLFVVSAEQMKRYIRVLPRNGPECPYQKVHALMSRHLANKKNIARTFEDTMCFDVLPNLGLNLNDVRQNDIALTPNCR
jgi:hypothetical protein